MKTSANTILVTSLMSMISVLGAWSQTGESNSAAKSVPSPGQAAPVHLSAEVRPGSEASKKPVVGESQAVITIRGVCRDAYLPSATAADSCKTVVTREEFEKLLDAMNVMDKAIAPETRRNLAEVYAQYLTFEQPAIKAGLDATQRYEEIMRWWRLRTLAVLYRGNLQEEFKNPSAAEIHAYYVSHLAAYQRLTIARIMVPRPPLSAADTKRLDDKALETAKAARERAAQGEDPDVVQQDAYKALGMSSPPLTKLGSTPRANFPADETDELFALKPGEVSKIETEGSSYVMYKVLANETLPEERVKDDVAHAIAQGKYDAAIRAIDESAKPEFNDTYFGPPAAKAAESRATNPHP